MSDVLVILLGFISVLVFGYRNYGSRLVKTFGIDDKIATPAHVKGDGRDFVPTSRFFLFGQHFSAIAAAGPIAGPIAACLAFGWLPALLWIAVGVIVIGAVHDFGSLAISVKSGGQSIAEIAREQIGHPAGRALRAFILLALIYVIVAFASITAGSFVTAPEEILGVEVDFNPGGAVAMSSILYLALSLVLGVVQRFLTPPDWLTTIVFVPLTFLTAWAGTWFSNMLVLSATQWGVLIVIYCGVASMLPVWLLLQPRGFLGGFVLYFALAAGVLGIILGDFSIQQPAFKGWDLGTPGGMLFPFLFVTIACGACSGFHGLVCTGTTSKQVDRESHIHSIGYGAMLAEGLVALLALSIVMIASPQEVQGLKPGTIYGNGLGKFIALVIGNDFLPFAITLGAMVFSTFVFDTLDVSARLGRYLIQEALNLKGISGAVVGILGTLAIPFLMMTSSHDGEWTKFWTLFGASNQLLAALTLLTISVWLARRGKNVWTSLIPSLFVLMVTITALTQIAVTGLNEAELVNSGKINALAAIGLIVLALYFCWKTAMALVSIQKAQP